MTQSLWYDEAYRTHVVLGTEGASHLLLHDVHNPLYNAFMWVWIRVVGDSEASIRTPSLLAGAGVVWLTWAFAAGRWGRPVADFAAAWMLLAPAHVWYSAEAKNCMFVVFFSLLALTSLVSAMERRTAGAVLWAGLAGGLAVWTDWLSLLVLAPAWLAAGLLAAPDTPGVGAPAPGWSLAPESRFRRLALLFLIVVVTLVIALPLVLFKAADIGRLSRDYLRYFQPMRVFWMLSVWLPTADALVQHDRIGWFAKSMTMSVLFIPIVWLGVRRLRSTPGGVMIVVCLFAPMVILWGASEVLVRVGAATRVYQERNLLVMMPLYAIVVSAGVMSLGSRARRRALCTAVLALSGACSALMYTVWRDKTTVMVPPPDWRAAARLAEERMATGRRVGVVSQTPLRTMRYYSAAAVLIEIPERADVTADVTRLAREHAWDEVLLITNPYWNWVPPAQVARVSERFEESEIIELRLLTVVRLRGLKPPGASP